MANAPITREDVVACLRDQHAAMRALGVKRLALFGSVARNTATAESDVDLLVEFEPGRQNYDAWLALADLLESARHGRVDLVTREGRSPFLGPHILAEAVDVLRAS